MQAGSNGLFFFTIKKAISESLNYQKAWKVALLLGLSDIHIVRNLTGI